MKNKPFFNGHNNNNKKRKKSWWKQGMKEQPIQNPTHFIEESKEKIHENVSLFINTSSIRFNDATEKEYNGMIKTCRQLFTLISNLERLECRVN